MQSEYSTVTLQEGGGGSAWGAVYIQRSACTKNEVGRQYFVYPGRLLKAMCGSTSGALFFFFLVSLSEIAATSENRKLNTMMVAPENPILRTLLRTLCTKKKNTGIPYIA